MASYLPIPRLQVADGEDLPPSVQLVLCLVPEFAHLLVDLSAILHRSGTMRSDRFLPQGARLVQKAHCEVKPRGLAEG